MHQIDTIVMGQSTEIFEASGYAVSTWQRVRARGRRRMIMWDGEHTLAVHIVSTSDIDDLVPIVVAYQIEWNKMYDRLCASASEQSHAQRLGISEEDLQRLHEALGPNATTALDVMDSRALDLRLRLPTGSYREYQKAAEIWWRGI